MDAIRSSSALTSALTMSLQISRSILKQNAQAEQAIAAMVEQNAEQIAKLRQSQGNGHVDIKI